MFVVHFCGMLRSHTFFTQVSCALLSAQPDFMSAIFFSRADVYDSTICFNSVSAFLTALLRSLSISSRIADMWSSHPDADTLHSAKYLLKSASDSHWRKSGVQRLSAIKQPWISDVQAVFDFFLPALVIDWLILALTPAALHDCSIKGSYVSLTSSVVHAVNFCRHNLVAQAYLSPGSSGAFFRSLSLMLYFADAPTETLRIAFLDDGLPAVAVPQYWHRAAAFDDWFIAHAESKQRVRLAREHVAAPYAVPPINNIGNIYNMCVLIFSLGVNYSKNALFMQTEKQKKLTFRLTKGGGLSITVIE